MDNKEVSGETTAPACVSPFSFLSMSLLLRKNLPGGVLDVHLPNLLFPKALLVLVVGSVEDWTAVASHAMLGGLCKEAAFVKITHVVVGAEASNEDGRTAAAAAAAKEKIKMGEHKDNTPTDSIISSWKKRTQLALKRHMEQGLKSNAVDTDAAVVAAAATLCFTGTLQTISSSQPRYVDVSLLKDVEQLKAWEFKGTVSTHTNLQVNCFTSRGNGRSSTKEQTTVDILDTRLIGKFDRCCVRTNAPHQLLPKLRNLVRPGGWLLVKVVGDDGAAMEEVCTRFKWKCHAVSTTCAVDEENRLIKIIEYLVVTPEQNGYATLRLPSCPCCQ